MLVKTPGIVLRNTKYSDSTVICRIYTRQLGMQTYIINGIRSPKAAIKPSLLMPLVILDMVVYRNPLKEIQRIREAKSFPPLHTFHTDVYKISIGMFMAELANKTIREEEPNEQLFDFLAACILKIDEQEKPSGLWPLYFMVHYTRWLGFFPRDNASAERVYFDMREGSFVDIPSAAANVIEPPHSEYLRQIIHISPDEMAQLRIPKNTRAHLLARMMDYYLLHLPEFHPLKSVEVLQNIMRED